MERLAPLTGRSPVPGPSHVDPRRRRPLLYVFRHYMAASEHLGKTFRAEA